MTDSENLLTAFHSFANLFEPIWFWKMDSEFHVLQSDCPHESLFRSLLLQEGRREAIEAHIATTDRPVCFTVPSMLSWIIGFAPEGGKIHNIYLVGPFFLDYKDPESSADRMAQTDLTQEAQAALQAALPTLPVLSSETLVQYAVILHYCIRQERLAPSEVVHYVARPKTRKHSKSVETNQFEKSSGRWSMEQELLNRIRRGDLSAGEVLTNAGPGQSVQAFGNVQNLYAMRLNLHQLLTLVSRAAVDGGLPQRTAFSLCSDYRCRLETSRTAKELTQIGNEMVRDYAARVHNMKRYVRCSPAIRLCCEYIDTHPADKLTLEGLAAKAGYSPSHLSRKFYREMGCSIITYIQNSKLERACYLLANTIRSVDDISAELGFNARSYFTTVFKNHIGMSPTEYRRENSTV